jgi:hypothetical protein
LYNQTAKRLRTALLGRPDTVVTAVPYRREAVQPAPRPAVHRAPAQVPATTGAADSGADVLDEADDPFA